MVKHEKGSEFEPSEPFVVVNRRRQPAHSFQVPLILRCRFPARPEILNIVPLISVSCRHCRLTFCVCRSCWRGQAYCCDHCRYAARREACNRNQERYRQTRKGKLQHSSAEMRRRLRKMAKKMDDQGSPSVDHCATPICNLAPSAEHTGQGAGDLLHRCRFCGAVGEIVKGFPVRDGRTRQHENHRGRQWWKRE